MNSNVMTQTGLKSDALHNITVIVTGSGGGIGFETAKAILWLGGNVIIAEINPSSGEKAAEILGKEFSPQRVMFIQTDVRDAESVQNLYCKAITRFGKVDVVINNATIAVLGAVKDLPIEKWDASYHVNLRGPVLMAQTFLPDMINRHQGVFICVSSTGVAFLGGYETFKAAQVQLANTLDAELEGTGVVAFTIGPGLVPTETASRAVERIAPLMGLTVDEFFELNKNNILTPEEAGVGFALSIVFANQFKGMEISSMQALRAANFNFNANTDRDTLARKPEYSKEQVDQALILCKKVWTTLKEQTDGWKERSIFERQWVIRDFKKTAGMSVEDWLAIIVGIETNLRSGKISPRPDLLKLSDYYNHLVDLGKGYEKDASVLEEKLKIIYGWRDEVLALEKLLS